MHADPPRSPRRVWLRSLVVVAAGVVASAAWAQTNGGRAPSLLDRLTNGLQARLPAEKEFLVAVVDTVHRGDLPEKLVDRTFFWSRAHARRDGERPRRPIIYFRPALTAQAEKLGIDIRPDAQP